MLFILCKFKKKKKKKISKISVFLSTLFVASLPLSTITSVYNKGKSGPLFSRSSKSPTQSKSPEKPQLSSSDRRRFTGKPLASRKIDQIWRNTIVLLGFDERELMRLING
uniref:Uncharacterized protein n=1 Tax=Opuntia streptacantha TaxID=393608 RepID=A0A7C9DBT7_OPUST